MYRRVKEEKGWEDMEKFYGKYKRVWKGGEVEIYIFGIERGGELMVEVKGG